MKTFARLGHLPPSAKLVYKVLEMNGQADAEGSHPRDFAAVKDCPVCIEPAQAEKFLIEHYYFIDARESLYGLNTKPQEEVVAL